MSASGLSQYKILKKCLRFMTFIKSNIVILVKKIKYQKEFETVINVDITHMCATNFVSD